MLRSRLQKYVSLLARREGDWKALALCVATFVAALYLTLEVRTISARSPSFFYIAVVVSAMLSGWLGGLVTGLLSIFAYLVFIVAPNDSIALMGPEEFVQLGAFIVITSVIAMLTSALRHAYSESQESLQSKDEFVAKVSHELRTPINVIAGSLEHLRRISSSGHSEELVSVAEEACRTLGRVVDDLLDFSRISQDLIRVESSNFDLHSDIIFCMGVASAQNVNSELKISFEIDSQVPHSAWGDSVRLKQILGNVVGNAVKFTERGFVHLRVTQTRRRDNAFWVRFEVTDTGVGIPKEKLKAVFEPFVQLSLPSHSSNHGVGLGLSISKRLVQAIGGEMGCSSTFGRGSSFWFEVPLRVPSKKTNKPVFRTEVDPLRGEQRKRVLLVEDNLLNQKVLGWHLKELNYDFDVVGNRTEFCIRVESVRYDHILMDAHLSDSKAPELAAWLRTKGKLNQWVPLVVVTADTSPEMAAECRKAGVDGVLSKPVSLSELGRALRSMGSENRSLESKAELRLDVSYLDKLRELTGNQGVTSLAEIVNLYSELTPQRLADVRGAVERDDRDAAVWFAHSVKSSSSALGAIRMQSLCEEFEKNIAMWSQNRSFELIDELEREFQEVEFRLQQQLNVSPHTYPNPS
jgi:signal transduction histidine kinase/CheY-like chemotaxis protein/HPt (histidine-containing phosphotransfer) domain-containing protein